MTHTIALYFWLDAPFMLAVEALRFFGLVDVDVWVPQWLL